MRATSVAVLLALVSYVFGTPEAEPDVGYGAPHHDNHCKTHFITKYQDVIKQLPIHHTVFKTQLHPTEVYEPVFKEIYKTIIRNQFLPKYVTTTKFINQVKYVTDYKVVPQKAYETIIVTKNQVIPTYVTKTEYNTVHHTNVDHVTRYETQVVPTYVPTLVHAVKTQVVTNLVPEYSTVYSTYHDIQTVCPTGGVPALY